MKTKIFYELEISIRQEEEKYEFILINRFRTCKDLLDFKKKAEVRHGDTVKSITIRRINTELL